MDLLQIQQMGALVPLKLVKKTITVSRPVLKPAEEWKDPEIPEETGDREEVQIDVHYRRRTSADDIVLARTDEDMRTFVLLARLAVDPDGVEIFESAEQAARLASWMLVPLIKPLQEGYQAPKAKSTRATNSGSKSRSR